MTINKDLVLRLNNNHLAEYLRYCIEKNKDMDMFSLSDWNERISDLLYQNSY